MPAQTQTTTASAPPNPGVPFDSAEWQEWFYRLYERTGADGGVFPKLSLSSPKNGTFSFTNENFYQMLATVDMGIYSNYTSDNGNIIYGFACNVRRSGGTALTVGGQINAWGDAYGTGKEYGVFGANLVAVGPIGHEGALIGVEISPVRYGSATTSAKIGTELVFINRTDNGGPAPDGLGSNRYNYYSFAHRVTSQPRSPSGEFCGWNVGLGFLTDSMDECNPPAWSAVVAYQAGQMVTSGGAPYRAIQASVNQVPAAISAYWVPTGSAKAICIDFSTLSLQTMGRIGSAIRLRDTMSIDYDVTGAIGQFYDVGTGRMVLVRNSGLGAPPADRVLEVDVVTGFLYRFNVFLI